MWLGVRPIIRFASIPTARGRSSLVLTATTDGSLRTMPRPRTYTRVLAVPRSTAMSRPKKPARKLSDTRGSFLIERAREVRKRLPGGLGPVHPPEAYPPGQSLRRLSFPPLLPPATVVLWNVVPPLGLFVASAVLGGVSTSFHNCFGAGH